MDVKGSGTEDGASWSNGSTDAPGGGPPGGVETDLSELLRVMPKVFRALRRGAGNDSDGGPPASLKQLFETGALGPRHVPVLVVLVLDGPQAVGALARRLGLSLATVSLMTGELARAGLVERHEDERDRRRTVVSITERHRRRLAPLVEQRLAPMRRALERMPPEIRKGFLAGWHVLAEEIERSASDGR